MANRFDISTTKKWRMDARNRLIVESTPTRAGVFTYYNQNGERVRELRHPDDVFSRETMDSLNVIPYTTQENHTSLMTPENVRERTYGMTMADATRVDNHASIKIKITDGKEIKAVMNGESLELSNGYTCDIVKESGHFDGEEYDVRQKNIVYDHVARVKKARGGENCRIRLDSADSAICGIEAERLDSGNLSNSQDGENMADIKTVIVKRQVPLRVSGEFRLDALDLEINEDQNSIVDQLATREESLFGELAKVNSAYTQQTVKMDALEQENKSLKAGAEGMVSDERLDQVINDRIALFGLADQMGIKDYRDTPVSELETQVVKESGMFNEEKLDQAEYRKFALEHLQDEHGKKVVASRKNLESAKFDALPKGDLNRPSSLEQA